MDGIVALAVFATLMAFAVPQFQSRDAKEIALQRSLQELRDRIDLYRFQNESQPPGDEGTELDLLGDLRQVGRESSDAFPVNPINGKNSVHVSETHPRDGSTGWWYRPATGEIRANVEESPFGTQTGTVLSSL